MEWIGTVIAYRYRDLYIRNAHFVLEIYFE